TRRDRSTDDRFGLHRDDLVGEVAAVARLVEAGDRRAFVPGRFEVMADLLADRLERFEGPGVDAGGRLLPDRMADLCGLLPDLLGLAGGVDAVLAAIVGAGAPFEPAGRFHAGDDAGEGAGFDPE